jgi:DNA invertase Pin-like site-specific DNA recombinase
VSADLQKKERTIESQIAVLKSQIKEAGDILVKEYIDDGYSGARLDRPALDELRRDLKTPSFDSIYFLNADRIARCDLPDHHFRNPEAAEATHHQWPRLRREPDELLMPGERPTSLAVRTKRRDAVFI